jgi:hypothetical protein
MHRFLESGFFGGLLQLLFGLSLGLEFASSSVPIGAHGSSSTPIGTS